MSNMNYGYCDGFWIVGEMVFLKYLNKIAFYIASYKIHKNDTGNQLQIK